MKNKKLYAWYPENADTFYNTYDSLERCLINARHEYETSTGEFYNTNNKGMYSPNINVGEVEEIDIDDIVKRCYESFDYTISEAVNDFAFTTDCESEAYCEWDKVNEVKEKIKEIIEKYYYLNPTKKCNTYSHKYNLEENDWQY